MKTAVILFAILLLAVMAQAKAENQMTGSLLLRCEVDADPVKTIMVFYDGDMVTGRTYADVELMDGTFEEHIGLSGEPMNLHEMNLNLKQGHFHLKKIEKSGWEWDGGGASNRRSVTCTDLSA